MSVDFASRQLHRNRYTNFKKEIDVDRLEVRKHR
jgi:hypothetical protein